MQPMLVIILICFVELVVSARHTSREYTSEKNYRERVSTDSRHNHDSPEKTVKSKSRKAETLSRYKLKDESSEEYVPKSKYRNGGKYVSKSSKSRDRDRSHEEYVSRSKYRDGPNPKNDDLPKGPEKDLKPPGTGQGPANTEQVCS